MTRNRGSPNTGAILALILAAISLFMLAGWTNENDANDVMDDNAPNSLENDTTDNDAISDNTGAIGMPNLENTTNRLDANIASAMNTEDANGIANKVAGCNTEAYQNANAGMMTVLMRPNGNSGGNRYIMDANATAMLMRDTRLIMWRGNDGRRSNAPPMNDALAQGMLITPNSAQAGSAVMNC